MLLDGSFISHTVANLFALLESAFPVSDWRSLKVRRWTPFIGAFVLQAAQIPNDFEHA